MPKSTGSSSCAIVLFSTAETSLKDADIYPREVIELNARIKTLDSKDRREFHTYVKPFAKPKLTPYCIRLTGKYLCLTHET